MSIAEQRVRNLRNAFMTRRQGIVADIQGTIDAMTRCQKAAQRMDGQLGSRERFEALNAKRAKLEAELIALDEKATMRLAQAAGEA